MDVPDGVRIEGKPYEVATVRRLLESYHASFSTGLPQSGGG